MAEKIIGVGMIGCGTVGGGVATLLRDEAELYAQRLGARLQLRRVLVRDSAKAAHQGLVSPDLLTADVEAFFDTPDMAVVIEVAGGVEQALRFVRRALESGRHVVTANKALLAAHGSELFALARSKRCCIAFEASCAGGIPIITALQFGLMANRIEGLFAILNGTCNYILTEMTQKSKPYATALAEAQSAGYAEADPTLDVSGRDAAEKLSILASLAFGESLTGKDVASEGIDRLELDDIRFGAELGYDVKLLAISERWKDERGISANVMPCFISKRTLLGQVHGPYNALVVRGHAVGSTMFYGRGAGRLPTASAVVSDLLNVASGWYPQAFASMRLAHACSSGSPVHLISAADLWSRFYIRINALDVPGVMAKVTAALGQRGISLSAVMQHEANAGQVVPVVILTHAARLGDVQAALEAIEKLDVIQGTPVRFRIVDLPRE